jgi:urea transporter
VVALALEVAPGAVDVLGCNVAVVVLARVLEVVGDDNASVQALPLVEVVWELVGLAPVELVGEEALHPRAP